MIDTSSALACGVPGDGSATPSPAPYPSSSPTPSPTRGPWVAAAAADAAAAKAAASARAGAGVGGFFGGAAAGALGLLLFQLYRAGTLTSSVNKAIYGERIPLMQQKAQFSAAGSSA